MPKIIVASQNPVKINASLAGFKQMYPHEQFDILGVEIQSGVSAQPMDDTETILGARNRSQKVREQFPDGDFFVGIEGGVEMKSGAMEVFAWVVITAANGQEGRGRTGAFFLPPAVAELVSEGIELGEADDIVFGRTNSKQTNGAVGLLTDNAIDRTSYYIHAVILALIPFKNNSLYFAPN